MRLVEIVCIWPYQVGRQKAKVSSLRKLLLSPQPFVAFVGGIGRSGLRGSTFFAFLGPHQIKSSPSCRSPSAGCESPTLRATSRITFVLWVRICFSPFLQQFPTPSLGAGCILKSSGGRERHTHANTHTPQQILTFELDFCSSVASLKHFTKFRIRLDIV